MKKLQYLLFICVITILACKKDNPIPAGKYDNGLVILNEGTFGTGSGTVSFWDRDTMTTVTDIYANENNGAKLGNVLQSMTQVGDELFFVVNNSNKIVITDKSFKYKSQIDGFELPRYMITNNGKAYVSQWGNDGISGSLAIVDLNSKTILKTIPLGKGPENMFLDGNTLFVSMAGGYDKDNRIFKVNLNDESVTSFVLADNPSTMIKIDNSYWVLCKGYFNFANPPASTNGKLLKLDGENIVKTVDLSSQAESLILSNDKLFLYLLVGNQPNKYKISSNVLTPSIISNIYKMGYDAISNKILLGDALDYNSNGKVYFMDDEFKLTDTISVGIVPTAFYQIQ
ncbi:MAG TPA: DUF5074 domain-containing protein [Saprospiraceae bacterium]|nr:DUF5074 domain-containing protein [Saprospiraceae bacterium]